MRLFPLLLLIFLLSGCRSQHTIKGEDQDVVYGAVVFGFGFIFLRIDDDKKDISIDTEKDSGE
jgi:uncharacterized protein YcfL